MSSQIQLVVNEIRRRVLLGEYQAGERLVELKISAELGVSRTPIRLAFEELAKDGVLERLETRGFKVKRFDRKSLSDAIDVRGVLEGMAARSLAEVGMKIEVSNVLSACVQDGRELLIDAAANEKKIDASKWMQMNATFHETLVNASENIALVEALRHVSKNPMASAARLSLTGSAPELEYSFIERAQRDHEDILEALIAREGSRVEALMREHARRSRDNKSRLLKMP
jgi:GntR family transcriptional regulator, vanillate catabolism transcriptional regulator